MVLGLAALSGVYFLVIQGKGFHLFGSPASSPGDRPLGQIHQSDNFNYTYIFPPAAWKQDKDTQIAVQANLFVLKRNQPDAWMALLAKDYKTVTPRDGQVLDEVVKRLEKHFTDLEYELKPDGQLAGQRATKFVFQGKAGGQGLMVGEAYLMAYQGIAYAWLGWAPPDAAEQAFAEFDDLRLRFSLLHFRDRWSDTRADTVAFQGSQLPYSLRDNQAIWRQNADYLELFKADLALEAFDPGNPNAKTNSAVVLVFLQPRRDDVKSAAAQARGFLEKEQQKDFPQTKVEAIPGKGGPLEGEASIGDRPGHLAKLHVVNGENRQRYVLLATVPAADRTVVIQCECPWERRSLWERDFDQLVGTFRLK